ncbi:MAG TPA: hypothetical protein VGR94_06830 [Candidatus Acidoferrales bacterium]|nr:hypothetical protein [Candidatus Acidoferrales bacterium]HEV2499671.1 hypothetical protein [Terriglobia bacterium]
MNWQMAGHTRVFALAATGLLLAAVGCNVTPPQQVEKGTVETASKTAVTSDISSTSSDNPGIDLQCVADRIRKAPVPFHWSFKKVVPPMTNADWEADVTPDSIAGTLIDGSSTRAIHSVRSDSTSWSTAVLALTGPLPASTFALVNSSSATVRAGSEGVNGEKTIKYAIDTAQDKPADASLIRSVLGANGSVKGAAWVTRNGCPVKFVLDVEQHNNDGTVQKEHYEANVTKP